MGVLFIKTLQHVKLENLKRVKYENTETKLFLKFVLSDYTIAIL